MDLVEGGGDVAKVLPDHLLRETLPRQEEPRHRGRRVVQKSLQCLENGHIDR